MRLPSFFGRISLRRAQGKQHGHNGATVYGHTTPKRPTASYLRDYCTVGQRDPPPRAHQPLVAHAAIRP